MDLFHLINSSKGLGSEDIDLDVPGGFGAFIGYSSAKIFWLLLIAKLLQHLPKHLGIFPASNPPLQKFVNILIWKMNS
jgi:hypothetical protein